MSRPADPPPPVARERTLILQFIDRINQATSPREACAQAVAFLEGCTPFCNPDAFLVDPKDPNRVVRVANRGAYDPGPLVLARGQGVVEGLRGLGYPEASLVCRDRREGPVRPQAHSGTDLVLGSVEDLLRDGGGAVGRILATGEPYLCLDVRQDPLVVVLSPQTRCELGVPLRGEDGHSWGVLRVGRPEPRSLSLTQDGELLSALASYLVLRLERQEAFDSLGRELDRMRLLHGMVQELGRARDLEDLARMVADLVARRMGCHMVSLYRVEEEGPHLRFLASNAIPEGHRDRWTEELRRRGGGLVGRCARTGRLMNHRDIGPGEGFVTLVASGTRHQLDVPVCFGGRMRGILSLESSDRPFDEEDEAAFQVLTGHLAALWEVRDLMGQMRLQTLEDPLTGLWNRRYLEARLQEEQERLRRTGEPFSLAMVDLTDFKTVNDRYGHFVGDLVLREVASCLKTSVRSSDVVARFGGDEFLVLFPRTGPDGAEEVMHRFEALLGHLEVPGGPRGVLCDCGVVSFPEDGRDLTELLELADRRMYRHKGARKAPTYPEGKVGSP